MFLSGLHVISVYCVKFCGPGVTQQIRFKLCPFKHKVKHALLHWVKIHHEE